MDAQILNDILSVFTGSIDGTIAVLTGIGLSLFGILALISYYQRYATTVLSGGGLGDALASFLLILGGIGAGYWVMLNLAAMTDALYQTFLTWGGTGGGFTGSQMLNPGVIVDTGFRLARPIRTLTDNLIGWMAVWSWPTMLTYTLSYYAMVLSFFFLAAHLLFVIVEFKLSVLAACVLVPCGIWSPTAFLAEAGVGWVVGSVVRVFLTAVLMGLAFPLLSRVTFTASSGGDPTFFSAVLCGGVSLLFAILAWQVPARAAGLVGRGLALSGFQLADAAATGTRFAMAGYWAAQGVLRGTSRLVTQLRG